MAGALAVVGTGIVGAVASGVVNDAFGACCCLHCAGRAEALLGLRGTD